jgi:transposase
MARASNRHRRLWDTYSFAGFRPQPTVRGIFGDPKARIIALKRRSKCCGRVQTGWYDRKVRQVRDLSCGDTRIFLELEVRRLDCRSCGKSR